MKRRVSWRWLSVVLIVPIAIVGCGSAACVLPLLGGSVTGGAVAAALLNQWSSSNSTDTGAQQQIPGIQGPEGPAGPAGQDGVQGATGPAGADGAQGPAGPDGANGADGADGANGADGVNGADGADGADGANGADGAQGPAGPTYIDVLIEDFWTCDPKGFTGGVVVQTVRIAEPRFGMVTSSKGGHECDSLGRNKDRSSVGPLAFRAMVPAVYALNPDAPLTLRLFIFQCDDSGAAGSAPDGKKWDNTDDALTFSFIGKRLLGIGSAIQDYGSPRVVDVVSFPAGEMRIIDLPLGIGGLECPDVSAGDFLAFELNTLGSNAVYRMLGAEIFSGEEAVLANATVEPLASID